MHEHLTNEKDAMSRHAQLAPACHLHGPPSTSVTKSNQEEFIYLPIRLNSRRGHRTGSGEPSAGGSFCVSYCAVLVVSE